MQTKPPVPKTTDLLGTISLIAGERALLSSGEIREWTGAAWKIIPGDWRLHPLDWR